jgi:hypothetical protein
LHLHSAGRAAVLEHSGIQVGAGARQRVDGPVVGAVVAALAVDHHRRRQHQTLAAGGEHLGEQHRGAVVVVAGVGRRVGGIDARADDGGLVAHHVDAREQRRQGGRVADVEHLAVGRRFGAGAVRGREHRVDGDHVVAGVAQSGPHPGPDEARRAGQQNSHGKSNGNSTPSCGRQWVHARSTVT